MLNGEYGWIYAKALKLIVKVGEALGAEKLVKIRHAHVSGVSFSNIGYPGLEFIRDFYVEGAEARIYTTVNPTCIDVLMQSTLISREYADKQLEINRFLEGMDFKPTYTCIPYLYRRPFTGEHLAWGESSAVIVSNSIFGARTNREGGPIALAAALTGYTYFAGLHLDENRVVNVVIAPSIRDGAYGALGLWIGYNIKEIPMIRGLKTSLYEYKLLLAAAAASGDHALIVLDGITPRDSYTGCDSCERISVTQRDLEDIKGSPPSEGDEVLGYIGCPHLDPTEFVDLYNLIVRRASKGFKRGRKLLLTIPPLVAKMYFEEINILRKIGVDVAAGTCPIVSKLTSAFDYIVTDSGKAAFYMSRRHGIKTYVSSTTDVLNEVFRD